MSLKSQNTNWIPGNTITINFQTNGIKFDYQPNKYSEQEFNDRLGYSFYKMNDYYHWFSTFTETFIPLKFKATKSISEIKTWLLNKTQYTLDQVFTKIENKDEIANNFKADTGNTSNLLKEGIDLITTNNGGEYPTRKYNFTVNPQYNSSGSNCGIQRFLSDGSFSETLGYNSSHQQCSLKSSSAFQSLMSDALKSESHYNSWVISKFWTERDKDNSWCCCPAISFFASFDPKAIKINIEQTSSGAINLKATQSYDPWKFYVVAFGMPWQSNMSSFTYDCNHERLRGEALYAWTMQSSGIYYRSDWWEFCEEWCSKGNMAATTKIKNTYKISDGHNPLIE